MFTSNDLFSLFSIYDLTFTNGMEMKLAFSYNADPDDTSTNEKAIESSDEDDDDYNPGGYEPVFCFEDELEIMAILNAQEIEPDIEEYGDNSRRVYLNTVTFYDSNTYEKLKTMIIDQKVKCGTERGPISMDLDRDILIIRIKEARIKTLVWRLSFLKPKIDIDGNKSVPNDAIGGKALNEGEEGSSAVRKSSRQKKKTSRSQPESNWEPERTRTTRSASKKI